MRRALSSFLIAGCLVALSAQEPNPTQTGPAATGPGGEPIFKVTVVSRTTPAVNFHHRQGTTYVDLRGTALMPRAEGKVKVDANTGATKLHVDVSKMVPATNFGPEYLTYVIWAVTPEGNAKNLGELVIHGSDKSGLDATTDLQAFGLIVTAEPYWAVSQPSDVVVMENMIRQDTTGTIETINAKYELLQRGTYVRNIDVNRLVAATKSRENDLELAEAEAAVAIARAQGADRFAKDTIDKALVDLQNAEGFAHSKRNGKEEITVARAATQGAEDARLISIRKEQAEALAAERQAAADAQASAEAKARAEAQRAAAANADRAAAETARADAERLRKEAEQAREQAMLEKQQADAARSQADAARSQAEKDAAAARASAASAESDKAALREKLLAQLNSILATRDTARGLIMNLSDVLFDFGKADLRGEAREKLAKISGILIAYPSLHVQVEGNTDSVGSDEFNQNLSEKRAFNVRDYLTQQGVNGNNLTAVGYGKTHPIASNDTAEGRQQNRRVEMVVSGDIIGTPINSDPNAAPATPAPTPQQ